MGKGGRDDLRGLGVMGERNLREINSPLPAGGIFFSRTCAMCTCGVAMILLSQNCITTFL